MSQETPQPQADLPRQPDAQRISDDSGTINQETLVESLLFVADEPVTVSRLAQALEVTPGEIEQALADLREKYADRGVRLQRVGSRVQLVSAPESASYIERFLGLELHSRLSAAALEALTIAAYQQPVTRHQVEAVRGVNSDSVLRTLVGKGLIEEVGRLDAVGRPILYGTTFEFLQFFGLASLHELPDLELLAEDQTLEIEPLTHQQATENGADKD
jgi:segregation and condensation protein B